MCEEGISEELNRMSFFFYFLTRIKSCMWYCISLGAGYCTESANSFSFNRNKLLLDMCFFFSSKTNRLLFVAET